MQIKIELQTDLMITEFGNKDFWGDQLENSGTHMCVISSFEARFMRNLTN